MAQCEICKDFNEDHIDNEGDDSLYKSEQYNPNLYFYWHGDIEEDYDTYKYDYSNYMSNNEDISSTPRGDLRSQYI